MAPTEHTPESDEGTDQPPTFELTVAQPAWWADNLPALEECLLIAKQPEHPIFMTLTGGIFALFDLAPFEPGPEWNFALRVPDELPDGYEAVPDKLRKANRLTLSVEEAAEILGISRALAYDAVRRGEIPHIKIGRRLLVPKAALDRLLEIASETRPTTNGAGPLAPGR